MYGFSTNDELPHFITEGVVDDPFAQYNPLPSGLEHRRKLSTLAGKMQQLHIGAEYEVKATYKNDKTYGHQYNPISVFALIPQSKETQILFLKSIIPETIAESLITAYPNIVNDVVSGQIKDIDYEKVKGVRELTWQRVKDKILSNYIISDIITLLRPLGVTYVMIKKLLRDEPNPILLKQELLNNPYVMTRVDGLGFKKVDDLALKLKPELLNSTERLTAYVVYYLKELGESEGHTWVSKSIFTSDISNNVPECMDKLDWLLEHNTFLYQENDKIGLKYYRDVENRIFEKLKNKSCMKTENWLTDQQIATAINEAEKEQGFEYVQEQLDVIYNTLHSPIGIITGKGGTGKTSIMRAILKAYSMNHKSVSACALSAMAAQRISEATNYPATTIHRALGCQGINTFTYDKDNQMIVDVAFVDEGSMVGASLFLHWLDAIRDNTRIIIAGDHKQLPPIGYGNIFSDMIDKLPTNVVNKLTKPMRQALKSGILVDANLIRENQNPITETIQSKIIHGELQDMYYMFKDNRQSIFNTAMKLYLSAVETDGVDNVTIIVPRRKDCLNSTQEFNNAIQEKLLGDVSQEISAYDMTFKLGAKVMQTVNDYDNNVFNGEIGYITKIDIETDGKKKVPYCEVTFSNNTCNKVVRYLQKELAQLDLAYALTCHKIQGGARNTVIGVIDNTHYKLLDNCMLYTLLTRAKKRCCLVAEPQAFLKCIRTSHNQRNTWTKLIEDETNETSN